MKEQQEQIKAFHKYQYVILDVENNFIGFYNSFQTVRELCKNHEDWYYYKLGKFITFDIV